MFISVLVRDDELGGKTVRERLDGKFLLARTRRAISFVEGIAPLNLDR